VLLTALFTFSDLNESYHATSEGRPDLHRRTSSGAPPLPPKPELRVGVERIAEMQAYKGEVNELVVEDEGEIEDYAGHGWNLLKDEAMLFISVRSETMENVPRVLHVVEEIKRLRHKAGLDEEGELRQYVIYEQAKPKAKGPKIIRLDDPKGKGPDVEDYTPPTSLTVHLSKIDMPELKPRVNSQPPDKNIVKEWEKKEKGKGKEREREKEKEKGKDKRKEDEKNPKQSPSLPLGKRKPSSSPLKPPPSPRYTIPPPIPDDDQPTSNAWAFYPGLSLNQPPDRPQSGALNTAEPPPPPPQLSLMVSNLVGRFTKR